MLELLSSEERATFADMKELFASPGWRRVVAAAQADYEESAALYDKVGNDVGFARIQGYRNAIKEHILGAEEKVDNLVHALIEERKALQAEALEDDLAAG